MNRWTPEQKQAIEKDKTNIIVSAGAGSGKTAVLSERVINKLKNGTHINELLILTFTNAAAAEMKDRIRKKIKKDESLKNELELLPSSYITTFDSYALSILKKYYYVLNNSSNIKVTDESIVKLEEKRIIDEIFEELYESENIRFLDLINNYCNKNDKRLRENILKIANKINSDINSSQYIFKIRNEYFSDDNLNKIVDDYDKFIKSKKKIIGLELENINRYFDSDYSSKVYELVNGLLECDTNNLHLYSEISLPIKRGISEESKAYKQNLKKLLDELISYGKYGDYSQIKNSILSSKNSVYTILDIIEEYIFRLKKYKKENDIYTFNDIAVLSIKILKENKDIADEIKNSFKEIMIDEYQDTNDIQDTFINLISDSNVYMVGDIKQSIYKFRGSNPNIFREKYDRFALNDGGIKIDLIKNFRSRSEVVSNINDIFDLLMDNSIGGANYKESHRMNYGNITYDENKIDKYDYNMEIFEYENDGKEYSNNEIEIFKIARDIKEKIKNGFEVFDKDSGKLRKAKYNDFVIILDRSKYFNDYKKIFEYLSIPLTILKDEQLNTSTDMLLLKNLIDIVNKINNNDFGIKFKYDFISIARSFLYEYSDNEIFNIFKNNLFKETGIYKDLSKIDDINSMSVSMLIEKILDATDYYNKIYKIGNYEEVNVRLNTMYNMSINTNDLGYDISDFIDYLDNIIENGIEIKYNAFSSGGDSVKIMTIHKSKGLEYPICYFADLDHKFNMQEFKDEFISSNTYGLIVPYENENSIIKELYKYELLKDEIAEKLRLLYVALTRAREKIIMVLPKKKINKQELNENGTIEEIRRINISKLSDFIFYVKEYLPVFYKDINISKLELSKEYLFNKKIDNMLDNADNDFMVDEIRFEEEVLDNKHFSKEVNSIISKEEYDVMKYGKCVHEILEYTDFKNIKLDNIKDKIILNKVNSFLKSKIFENIENAKIYKEYEFIYIKDNQEYRGVIDLMLEYTDYIDIVDYKLKNIDDQKYINQLIGYKNYIESISIKKVNLYLYSIMDEEVKKIN